MDTMTHEVGLVTVGIDTHRDVHVAAVLDAQGRELGSASFPTTAAGHRALARWAGEFGSIDAIGIEGTGAWGAGIARDLTRRGYRIYEVDRPDRKTRRRHGKSDTIDAYAAARAVQAGTASGTPKTRDGNIESIRALRVARRSAVKARTQAIVQIRCLVSTAPDELRDTLRTLTATQLVITTARYRPNPTTTPTHATKLALRSIARRYQHLNDEIRELDIQLDALVAQTAPGLLATHGVGTDVAGQLLVTTGDNPHRITSEAKFAHLCGTAPIPASSGRTDRHRLNRGGDRQANAALHRIAITRLRSHEPTRAYMQRRTQQGLTKREIIRCLKRYIAREIYNELTNPTT
ncbi:MAG TPA: IS110 family transposase [Acidimicrobiia bacterium]